MFCDSGPIPCEPDPAVEPALLDPVPDPEVLCAGPELDPVFGADVPVGVPEPGLDGRHRRLSFA